jgi:hypothetical protein
VSWTSPRTWVASEVLTAALLNTHVRDNLLELNGTSGAWTAYTPTTANFTGSLSFARYKQISKTVFVQGAYTVTSATGNMSISLPVTAVASLAAGSPVGSAIASDSGTAYYAGVSWITSPGVMSFAGSTGTIWQAAIPFTWASDALFFNATYEAA